MENKNKIGIVALIFGLIAIGTGTGTIQNWLEVTCTNCTLDNPTFVNYSFTPSNIFDEVYTNVITVKDASVLSIYSTFFGTKYAYIDLNTVTPDLTLGATNGSSSNKIVINSTNTNLYGNLNLRGYTVYNGYIQSAVTYTDSILNTIYTIGNYPSIIMGNPYIYLNIYNATTYQSKGINITDNAILFENTINIQNINASQQITNLNNSINGGQYKINVPQSSNNPLVVIAARTFSSIVSFISISSSGSADTMGQVFSIRGARGTFNDPNQTLQNDRLGSLQFAGYAGDIEAYSSPSASITSYASENLTSTSSGGTIIFGTRSNGTASTITPPARLTIAESGNITISSLADSGNKYVCVDSTGKLYRASVCV